ncbi:DUF3862 domain-containing protein [Lactiplantibacillus plantarum]|uniref:DUF3862 domain-containing protein n=1 Tax=Lactiplantibacillus plantarum TaxID=1590 RepID=UPI00077DF296|nr:DUF3862 domain-containing protein [Lactiplantibacillus plantarum]AXH04282.1 phage immunity protein [Lactiplantibacillus plantarum]KYK05510.1 phage immunity protein [Lactiplantibacillus plantarum]MCT3234443.1 DUF3862 domain-containing protein [Lactiplantibacillus plantarum]
MSKKVVGEDGRTYKVKKPFYKRVWFWILAVIVVLVIGGSLGSKSNSNHTDNSNKSTSAKTDNSGKITRSQFDSIKIGDLMNNAQGGDTLDSLKKKFGKPQSTSSDTTNGVKTDVVTWTNVAGGFGANVIVSFTDNHAYDKNLTGYKLSRKQNIKLSDFESFNNGMKYSDFTAKWGQPDYYNESLINGSTTIIAGYTSGVKGGLGANFNVTFTNGALSGKTQSDMK